VINRTALCALMLSLVVSSATRAQSAPVVIPTSTVPDSPLPAYKLNLALDLTALGTLAIVASGRLFASGHSICPSSVDPTTGKTTYLCDRNDVNSIDRGSAGNYNLQWQNAANIGLYGTLGGTALVLLFDEGFSRGINDATVVTESILGAAAMSSILTLAVARPRPYMYSANTPAAERAGVDGTESFLSGHTATVAAAGTALFITEHRLHPDSAGPYIILGVSTAVVGFVSVARTMGGNHFPSDNAIGALSGVAMGVLFPMLHDQPVHVAPVVSDQTKGLSLQGTF
jgi:membrane-associated phospholipid phosphatase